MPGRTTQVEVEFRAPGELQLSLIWNLPPERPQNVMAVWSNITDTVTITWDLVPGAEGYLVTRANTLGATPIRLNSTPILDTSIVDDEIVRGVTYLYRVASYYENGLSSRFSAEATVTAVLPGEVVTFDMEGFSFNMVYAPAATFPAGANDDRIGVVDRGFFIGQTEVTYELWYVVRAWALHNEYTFANLGMEGSTTGGGDYPNIGKSPTLQSNEPVTMVSWRDSIVWTNALSEMVGYDPVYTYQGSVVRDSTNATACENAVQENTDGFRLPTSDEWELAARYKGNDSSNGAIKLGSLYWTPGNYASGATSNTGNATATEEVAWYSANSGSSTKEVGLKRQNGLGVYDMSGNVSEWTFTQFGYDERVRRGGSGHVDASFMQVGPIRSADRPFYFSYSIGLRLARTQF